MADCIRIPRLTIYPRYIVLHNEYTGGSYSLRSSRPKPTPPVNTDTQGIISTRAAIKIKKAIEWLLLFANEKKAYSSRKGKHYMFTVAFITLTLSSKQKHPDNIIKSKCLNQFLIEAKKKWNVRNYLWRAESQKNGNIHFHVLVDKFCPWSEVRDTWNRIQNKLGYVDEYRKEMNRFHKGGFKVRKELLDRWSYKSQIRAYKTGSQQDWNSPNSTDVHSVRLINNLPAYLAKYCTKNDPARQIGGKLWGINTELSNTKGATDVVDSRYTEELQKLQVTGNCYVTYKDYYTIIYISFDRFLELECLHLFNLFINFIEFHKKNYQR